MSKQPRRTKYSKEDVPVGGSQWVDEATWDWDVAPPPGALAIFPVFPCPVPLRGPPPYDVSPLFLWRLPRPHVLPRRAGPL